jgi:hypothetical protein
MAGEARLDEVCDICNMRLRFHNGGDLLACLRRAMTLIRMLRLALGRSISTGTSLPEGLVDKEVGAP